MLLSGREVERLLKITHGERAKLQHTSVLPAMGSAGRSTVYDESIVRELQSRPDAMVDGPAVAVRLGEPTPADDEDPQTRQWRGWSQLWDDKTKANAARMWWPVADPGRLRGGTLVAVVAHVVVGVWHITGCARDPDTGRTAFDVRPLSSHPLTNTVLRIGRGPLIKVW